MLQDNEMETESESSVIPVVRPPDPDRPMLRAGMLCKFKNKIYAHNWHEDGFTWVYVLDAKQNNCRVLHLARERSPVVRWFDPEVLEIWDNGIKIYAAAQPVADKRSA